VKPRTAVIDTNIVVAGLLTAEGGSPTVRILDGMRQGMFPFLLSTALLAEYREVLLRDKIRKVHGLGGREIDLLLTEIATHAIVREPEAASGAPDPKDNHLWALALCVPGSALVTGDLTLARTPPPGTRVLSAKQFVEALLNP
jgi:putative PIN family toxin of toxin-antitoxin system